MERAGTCGRTWRGETCFRARGSAVRVTGGGGGTGCRGIASRIRRSSLVPAAFSRRTSITRSMTGGWDGKVVLRVLSRVGGAGAANGGTSWSASPCSVVAGRGGFTGMPSRCRAFRSRRSAICCTIHLPALPMADSTMMPTIIAPSSQSARWARKGMARKVVNEPLPRCGLRASRHLSSHVPLRSDWLSVRPMESRMAVSA